MSEPLKIYIGLIIVIPFLVMFITNVSVSNSGGLSAVLYFLSLISTHLVVNKIQSSLN
ncbi:hypothetical protein Bsel_0968 [[Bacillus] selenitireducens MLS10]|uniref:Uncharacterized protein n=1 Tax=Bacillus selenitireducens (strain ATCC 700615 / DSM 15326 / MLS10) TaxID=439292 RepID=D6Y099_BACIE|nr:hypothetical protein Bsel_0968 [[Bacillus] selenitireducens MLS10]